MANLELVIYNIAVFISTLFLLEYGADKFIDHAAVVARRTGIPGTIVGLITAGGEWEEVSLHRIRAIPGRLLLENHLLIALTI